MARPLSSAGDTRTYAQVGFTLLGGLLVSIAVMVLGLIVTAIKGGSTSNVLPLDSVLQHVVKGEGPAILDLGILLLFATPLAGIIVALVNFLIDRDGTFAAVSIVLLLMLVVSFTVALH